MLEPPPRSNAASPTQAASRRDADDAPILTPPSMLSAGPREPGHDSSEEPLGIHGSATTENDEPEQQADSTIETDTQNLIFATLLGMHRMYENPFTARFNTSTTQMDWLQLASNRAHYPFAVPRNCFTDYRRFLCTYLSSTLVSKNRYPFTTAKWTVDGKRIIVASQLGELRVLNSEFRLEDVKRLPGSVGSLTAIENVPDSSRVIVGDWGGFIHISSATLSPVATLKELMSHSILGLSASPSSCKLIAAASVSRPTLFDLEVLAKERVFSALGYGVSCVQWHPTDALIVAGFQSDQFGFWDPRVDDPVSVIVGHGGAVLTLRFSACGKKIATASKDTTIRIWDLRTMSCLKVFHPTARYTSATSSHNTASVFTTCLDWNPIHHNSQLLVSGDSTGTITYYDVEMDPTTFTTLSMHLPYPQVCAIEAAHDQAISSLNFHPFGANCISAGNDGKLKVWTPAPFTDMKPC